MVCSYDQQYWNKLASTYWVESFADFDERPCILGAYSRYYFAGDYRRVGLRKYALQYDNGYLDTPTSAARQYVKANYKQRRILWEQWQEIKGVSVPIFAQVGAWQEMVYIDIKAAWWNILLKVGWDCDVYPNRWLGIGKPPVDFPFPTNKIARSALVSVGMANSAHKWNGTKVVVEPSHNPLYNRQLYAFIALALTGIAELAIRECNAVYANNDGFICTSVNGAVRLARIIANCGLSHSIKAAGAGWVAGVGCYKIGAVKSRKSIHPREHPLTVYGGAAWARQKLENLQ